MVIFIYNRLSMVFLMEKNIETNKEISDGTSKSNSDEIKDTKVVNTNNTNQSNDKSQNNSPLINDIKNEKDIPSKTILKTKKELPISGSTKKRAINFSNPIKIPPKSKWNN